MDTGHNHPPRCCCETRPGGAMVHTCPLCPEHGELAQLGNPRPGECPICHSEIGKQHTEYCAFTGTVYAMAVHGDQVTTAAGTRTTATLRGEAGPEIHPRCKQDGGVLCSSSVECECKPTPLTTPTPGAATPATCGHPDYPDCPHSGHHP